MRERNEEILHAAYISLVAEGVAVGLFIAMGLVWMVIASQQVPV